MSNTLTTSETSRMPQQSHFQSLQRALMAGELEIGRDPRRRIRDLRTTSDLDWNQMAQLGQGGTRRRPSRRRA